MIQSPNDLKQYQARTLSNGLRVLLVHNENTQKSAAALAVNVGHFSDPCDRQGMAHFLEHMLFLGTKDYPDGSEYQKFISKFAGTHNAWTATEHTCFFFDISHLHFEPALERFSQFFIAPLLSEEFVNKERKNIDAEFKLKLKDGIRRLYDVHKETINPAHPFSKFSVGNTSTLDDRPDRSLHIEVREFYERHYRASSMTLVLEGPQPLTELERLAETLFTDIPSGKAPEQNIETPLYLPEHQQIFIKVKPIKNDRQLIISFALPGIDLMYLTKPETVLSYIIGYEGPGSILSLLKQKEWGLRLTAGSGINGFNFKDFNISISLTELGELHVDEIVSIVIDYVQQLNADTLQHFYYLEKKAIAGLSFHYHEKLKPLDSVCQLVINMQHYPEEHYLYGDYAMEGGNCDEVIPLLSYFNIENMRVTQVTKQGSFSKTSKWYTVPYEVLPFSSEQQALWASKRHYPQIMLPPKNNFIVEKPKVLAPELPDEQQLLVPQKIVNDNGFTMWFKQDVTFKVPKGYLYIGIDAPITYESHAHIAMTRLFADLYSDSVIEAHYDAELAGIHYHLYAHQGGMTLQVSGLSEKQPILLQSLLDELKSFEYTPARFNLFKQQLITHWKNTDTSKSISQLFSTLSSFMQPINPTAEQLVEALSDVNYEQFILFTKTLFDEIAITVFMHGNWHKKDALEVHSIIKSAFAEHYENSYSAKIPSLDISGQGNLKLPLHLPEHDHANVIYFPMRDKDLHTAALTMITSQLFSPPFFQQMRTEKQFGYLVGVGFVPINRYPGLAFYIQSPKVDAFSLSDAIENFISESAVIIREVSEEDWLHLKHGLAGQLQEKDTSMRIRSQRFWAAICNEEASFSQKKELIGIILSLALDDITTFVHEKLASLSDSVDYITLLSFKDKEYCQKITDTELAIYIENLTKKCSTKF